MKSSQLFLPLLFFSFKSILAQEKPNAKWGVKFNYEIPNVSIDEIYANDSSWVYIESYSFLNFPIAFQFYNRKNFNYHELGLSRLQIPMGSSGTLSSSNRNSGFDTLYPQAFKYNFQIGLRYAYYLKLGKKDKKAQFFLEFPLELFYHAYRKTGFNSNVFPVYTDVLGINTGITPHLQYFVYERKVFFDFAIPISLYNGLFAFSTVINPNLPAASHFFKAFHYSGTSFVSFRVGLGVKL